MKAIGFWVDEDDDFDENLPHPREFVDENWDPRERAVVLDYLQNGNEYMACLGCSWCRFRCGIADSEMGSKTLSDGAYIWPEGYPHYIEHHNVKPPEDFLNHVKARLQREGKTSVKDG